MKVALLFLLACVFTAVVDVQSAVFVKGGTRYPWPAPNPPATTNGSKTVQQNRRTSTAINSNRIRTRRADGSAQSVIVHQNPTVFEEQHPIDFDLKVRPSVQFVPGLKSVIDLPARTTKA